MRFITIIFLLLFSLLGFSQNTEYQIVWADEFDGEGVIDSEKWFHQTLLPNGQSWYNGEIQHYTNRQENSFVSDGTLKIVAKKGFFVDQGVAKEYTSARLNSKFAFTYGKVEVRAKLPFGVGTWPAIWTLGQNITEPGGFWTPTNGTTPWPACGEIDIMEHWGDSQDFVQSATHTPSSFGNTIKKGGQAIPGASNEFHIYTMEWTEDKIVFSVDDIEHYTYEPQTQNANTWPFDENQYLLLNVAILPNISPTFIESSMEIDFVRVYQEQVLDVDTSEVANIKVYPIPAKDQLILGVPSNYIGEELTVYSLLGQKIISQKIDARNQEVNVSVLQKGTYILKINTSQNSFSKLFLKE